MGQAAPFSGKWQWKHGQEALTLNLRQSGSRLTGWHAAIGQGGLRVDEAAPDQPPSIEGMINGETAEVTFRSTYPGSSAHGHATLKLRGGALYWHVVDTDGEEYLPDSARLTRR
jgi:hypothetical protein